MIEFDGYISGAAEQYFWNKARKLTQTILIASVLVFLPIIGLIAIKTKYWLLLVFYCTLFVWIPLLARIPKSKKEKLALLPKKIFTEDEYITVVAGDQEEYRQISDAKLVRDHGEFYEITFPVGKVSDKFICQKNLLTKGTLEDFEALFEGKITKV